MNQSKKIGRGNFLQISTLAGGGLLVSFAMRANGKDLLSATTSSTLSQFNPFLKIGEDNSIHIILSKVEMGQGIWTTLTMLIAEELDCDWKNIKVERSPPGKGDDFNQQLFIQTTRGSDSIKSEFDRYRQAGATARMMLVNAAAKDGEYGPMFAGQKIT